jgi:hypothetical protein
MHAGILEVAPLARFYNKDGAKTRRYGCDRRANSLVPVPALPPHAARRDTFNAAPACKAFVQNAWWLLRLTLLPI